MQKSQTEIEQAMLAVLLAVKTATQINLKSLIDLLTKMLEQLTPLYQSNAILTSVYRNEHRKELLMSEDSVKLSLSLVTGASLSDTKGTQYIEELEKKLKKVYVMNARQKLSVVEVALINGTKTGLDAEGLLKLKEELDRNVKSVYSTNNTLRLHKNGPEPEGNEYRGPRNG